MASSLGVNDAGTSSGAPCDQATAPSPSTRTAQAPWASSSAAPASPSVQPSSPSASAPSTARITRAGVPSSKFSFDSWKAMTVYRKKSSTTMRKASAVNSKSCFVKNRARLGMRFPRLRRAVPAMLIPASRACSRAPAP